MTLVRLVNIDLLDELNVHSWGQELWKGLTVNLVQGNELFSISLLLMQADILLVQVYENKVRDGYHIGNRAINLTNVNPTDSKTLNMRF